MRSNDSCNGYVNQYCYVQVLTILKERESGLPNHGKTTVVYCTKITRWIIICLCVKRFWAKSRTPVIQHPRYTLDIVLCDFWLFPSIIQRVKMSYRLKQSNKIYSRFKSIVKQGFPTLFQPIENTNETMH